MGDTSFASSGQAAGTELWGDAQLQGVMVNKTTPPVASPSEVLRQAICERVLQSQHARVVLVRAPVGYGKTTALRQIRDRLSQLGLFTGWLTLDRADNDLPRFLKSMEWALADILPEGRSAQPGAASTVISRITSSPRPFTLFLDDVETIHDTHVLEVLKELIVRLPDGARVMAASRFVPEWGLARLRVHGQLLEVDAQDLRFTQDEAASFFARRRHGPLPPAALAQLCRKTEGWIAPMWLASVALDRKGADSSFIDSFSGSNKAVAHYLARTVLSELPADVRQFLLRTSVLHQMTAPLCHALIPRSEAHGLADVERILDWLEEEEFFVRPVAQDGQSRAGRSWRYHSLFVDFLRDQLRRSQPHEYTRLHLAASAWFEAQGRPVPAIDHALEGGDVPQALTLLSQHAQRFVEQGRMRLLTRWFTLIPSSQLAPYPLLESIAIWATFFTKGPAEALSALQRSGCEFCSEPLVQAKLRTLRPLLMALLDRYEEALALGRDALAQLPSGCAFSDIGLANAMAHVASVVGDAGLTRQLLDDARRTPRSNPFTRTFTESVEGMLDLHDGRLQQATARLRMAVGESGSAMPVVTPANQIEGNAWAGVLYAAALYDANRLDDAQQRLSAYMPLAKETGLPDHMILGHALRARMACSLGQLDLAQEALGELEYLGHQRQLPRAVAAAHLERARIQLLQGQARLARESLDAADLPGLWERVNRQRLVAHDIEYLQLARIRWELHFGDARRAVALIESELAAAVRDGRGRRALKLNLMLALGLQQCADIAGSIQVAEKALRQACRDGFVRMVLDEGPAFLSVVQRLQRPHGTEDAGASRDPIWDDYIHTLVSALQSMSLAHQVHTEPLPVSREAELAGMTPQEIRVLQLLAEGCSNGDMATRLKVSDSTVRTHLRNINSKLGAHNRMQAIAAARRLAVIG